MFPYDDDDDLGEQMREHMRTAGAKARAEHDRIIEQSLIEALGDQDDTVLENE